MSYPAATHDESPAEIAQRALVETLRRRLSPRQVGVLEATLPSLPGTSDALLRGFVGARRV